MEKEKTAGDAERRVNHGLCRDLVSLQWAVVDGGRSGEASSSPSRDMQPMGAAKPPRSTHRGAHSLSGH
jgi:hypothetical protein